MSKRLDILMEKLKSLEIPVEKFSNNHYWVPVLRSKALENYDIDKIIWFGKNYGDDDNIIKVKICNKQNRYLSDDDISLTLEEALPLIARIYYEEINV